MAANPITAPALQVKEKAWADVLHTGAAAWVILGISLAITLGAWQLATSFAEKRAQDRFNFQVEEAQFAIQKRLTDYEQVLRGAIGLFQASTQVSREEWRIFTRTLQIEKHYPGIQGIGFSRWIPPEQKDAVISAIRAEGFSDFDIHPPGERDVYTAIVYLEPFDWRNQRAFGFDMYSETTRRAAMMHARDTGDTAMSGKVKLVQETERDVQNGFLMYLPLYHKGALLNSVEARRESLAGFVYSPFRIRDLMQGILGQGLPEIHFEIYDGRHKSAPNLLYASAGHNAIALEAAPEFTTDQILTFGGHTWTIHYASNPAFAAATRSTQPLIVAAGGVVIDLLLFYIIISLARLRKQALALAKERQNKLLEREGLFKAITDSAHEGIVSMEADGRITYVNQAVEHMFGIDRSELRGMNLQDLIAAQFRPLLKEKLDAPQNSPEPIEAIGLFINGAEFPLEISLSKWHAGPRAYASAILRDLTEPKRIERMKSEFLSTISHALRAPLTSIRGSLDLLRNTSRNADEDTQKLLHIADIHAERLSHLVDDMLDFEKLNSGKIGFDLQPLPVAALVHEALQASADLAAESDVRLEAASLCDAFIYVDQSRFVQVLINLLTHAITVSPAGATVRIMAESRHEFIRISIIHTEAGAAKPLPAPTHSRSRWLLDADSHVAGETGLGLSIAKSIVESFGGRLECERVPNIHTVFFVELPKYTQLALSPSID